MSDALVEEAAGDAGVEVEVESERVSAESLAGVNGPPGASANDNDDDDVKVSSTPVEVEDGASLETEQTQPKALGLEGALEHTELEEEDDVVAGATALDELEGNSVPAAEETPPSGPGEVGEPMAVNNPTEQKSLGDDEEESVHIKLPGTSLESGSGNSLLVDSEPQGEVQDTDDGTPLAKESNEGNEYYGSPPQRHRADDDLEALSSGTFLPVCSSLTSNGGEAKDNLHLHSGEVEEDEVVSPPTGGTLAVNASTSSAERMMSETQPVDSPPLQTPAAEESVAPKNAATLLDREILFDDRKFNMTSFDDGSPRAKQKVQGWANRKWIAASDKSLVFSMPVLRAMPGRFFWSSDVYEKRILAIFNNPDIILIMRLPKDADEVRRLAAIQGGLGLELSEPELHTFLVVESAADPTTCKVRLSQLTNPTSVPSEDFSRNNGQAWRNGRKSDPRRRSCFDLLLPTEVVTLSVAFLPDESLEDVDYTNKQSLNDTHRCEDAIVSALLNAHPASDAGCSNQALRHQFILGTIHSYVLSGSDEKLKDALSHDGMESNSDCKVPRTIDAKDASGKTALHYACSRSKNSTVQILVNAGADTSISQSFDGLTPCHLCATCLDEKSLSIILSASYPTRPDPNAIDFQGRTPMYLAAVEGRSNIALDLCLSALAAWGGQLTPDSPKSKELLHPVNIVSAQWKHAKLPVILAHCSFRYPLIGGSDSVGVSLSARFHYPCHAALMSLLPKIESAFQGTVKNEFNVEFMPLEPELVKTLQTLLEHGFEPNERLEGIASRGDAVKSMICFFGFTPLQILALAVAEARAINMKSHSEISHSEKDRIFRNIMTIIQGSVDILVKNGARINVLPPPLTRLDRPTPHKCYSLKEALEDVNAPSIQSVNREGLKLHGNTELLRLLGGVDHVRTFQNAFGSTGRAVENDGGLTITTSSQVVDCNEPGGSDASSCAICWSEFGVISNRKHLCRVSCRYVCNDCSTKRLIDNGKEQRVSDGQFLLAKSEAKKAAAKSQAKQEECMRKQRQSVTQARKSLGLKSGKSTGLAGAEVRQTQPTTKEKITNVFSGLGQTRNAVIDRGNKLESLAEKTDALNQASLDFASMAKELERSQNSWW
ncbi:hypothetical protein ACHAWF_010094 [Thalassiosira exigua]